MFEEYALCKAFRTLPSQLDKEDYKKMKEFTLIMAETARKEEIEMKRNRKSR